MSEDKLAAFRAFDFANHEAWQAYIKNIEIPAADYDNALARVKAKWYKKNVDADFDPSLVAAAPAAAPPPSAAKPAPSSTSTAGGAGQRPGFAGASSGGAGRPTFGGPPPSYRGPPGPATAQTPRFQLLLFVGHALLLLLAAVYLVPVVPRLSARAYKYFLQLAIITQGAKVYQNYGGPGFSLGALKTWAARVLSSSDAHYFLVAWMFMAAPSTAFVMVPYVVLAAYHASAYASRHFATVDLWKRYGARAHAWLGAHQTQALYLNAAAEIGTGFLLVIWIFTPARAILTTLVYWNSLKLRMHVPDAKEYHAMVWRQIDARTAPLRARLPVLNVPIGYVKRWFTAVPR